MKLTFSILVSAISYLIITSSLFAQRFELTPFAGYRFGGKIHGIEIQSQDSLTTGELKIANGVNYGLIFDISLNKDLQLEFHVERQNSELILKDNEFQDEVKLTDLTVDYYQVGLVIQPNTGETRVFIDFTFGLTRFDAKEDFDSEMRYSTGLALGLKRYLNKKIGFRLQSRWTATYIQSTNQLFCENSGLCFAVPKTVFMNQVDISGGIIIVL
jgi:hypothetical protein